MAVSLTPLNQQATTTWGPLTLGLATIATELILTDSNSEVLTIYALGGDIRLSTAGTDGAAIVADYTKIPNGNALPIRLRPSDRARTQGGQRVASLFVAGDSAGAVVISGTLELSADGNAQ